MAGNWKFSYRQKFISHNVGVYRKNSILMRIPCVNIDYIIRKISTLVSHNQISFLAETFVVLLTYNFESETITQGDPSVLNQIKFVIIGDDLDVLYFAVENS